MSAGEPWEFNGWSVEDAGIEYHLDVEDAETSLISVKPNWDDLQTLVDICSGRWNAVFEFNSPKLRRMMASANRYFDRHNEDETNERLDRAIASRVLRELRKRGIR